MNSPSSAQANLVVVGATRMVGWALHLFAGLSCATMPVDTIVGAKRSCVPMK
jgi:hypothetical protein